MNNQFVHLTNGEPDWDAYIAALGSKNVALYGITDYFTIDGYKELRQRQSAGQLPGVTLLPNIEFRLDHTLSSKHDGKAPRRLNLHVIFSEDVAPDDIEEHFLHDLNFVYEESPNDPSKRLSLKPSNLVKLGEKLIQEHKDFAGQNPLPVGATHAVVKLDEILDLLKRDPRFDNKYLIALPADGWNDIPWSGQDHHVRKTLLQAADVVLASNPRTIAWCLARPPYADGEKAFVQEFRTLKPCLHGSDAHSIEEIGHPCAKRGEKGHSCAGGGSGSCDLRNCWIKADPTFEGLKQTLYEPADRVRIQTADPTPSKTAYCLDSVEIQETEVSPTLRVETVRIPLNRGLIAVTGGRGSGKTALVDLIAHCFVDRVGAKDPNSFVGRVKDSARDFSTTLTFGGGVSFSKTLLSGSFFEDSQLVYIAQGELERYIGEGSDLNDYVHSLVFESAEIKNSTIAYEYGALAEQIQRQQEELADANRRIVALEAATSVERRSALTKSGKQVRAESEDLKKRVADAEAKLSPEKISQAEQRQKKLDELKATRQSLLAARGACQEASRFVDQDLARFGQVVARFNVLIATLGLGEPLGEFAYPDKTRVAALANTVETRLRAVLVDVEAQEKALRSLAVDQRDHAALLNKQREAEVKLTQMRAEWKDFEKLAADLDQQKQARTTSLRQLYQTVLLQRVKYDEIIQRFSASKDKVLADLDFQAEITVNAEALLAEAETVLDNRQAEVRGTERMPSEFQALLDGLKSLPTAGTAGVDTVVTETDRLAAALRDKLKTVRSMGPIGLDNLLYHSYLGVRPIVQYKKTDLERLSMGQKATVLMKIYLAEGDVPIIIDSHDDHLDNESIMDELVGSIRQARDFRQVILASNNGNVVVNSDVDQLIVATRTDGVIRYDSGSLENPAIREKALRVLEGGSDAFRKRQEKYRMV